jgi:Flp pilus assembly protein TadB
MRHDPENKSDDRSTSTPVAGSALPERELEQQVHEQALRLADLLRRVPDRSRSLMAQDAMSAIRDATGQHPEFALTPESPSTQNFGVFGLVLLAAGLMMTVFWRPLAFFGMVFVVVGLVISVLGFALRGRWKGGASEPRPASEETATRKRAA